MDCLLEGKSDGLSSIDIPNYRKDIQYHCVNIYTEENSSVNSGTDGGNSDTGVLADFSDDEEDVQYTPEMLEEIRRINEMGFRTDEDSPQWEQAFQQRLDADEDIPSWRDKIDTSGSQKQAGSKTDFPNGEHSEVVDRPVMESVTAQTESNTDFPSEEDSEFFGRPVMEPVTSRAGSDTDLPSDEHSEFFGQPVTNLVTAWVGSYTDHPSGEHLIFSNRLVTESVTARETDTEEPLVMNVSTVTIELSELRTRVLGETDTSDITVYKESCTPKCRKPVKVSPNAHTQLVISDIQWNYRDCCFGVCKKANSVNLSGTGLCGDCICWLVWAYRVLCLAAIVIKDWLHGIDLYTEKRRLCTSRPGLVGDPMKPCDILPVYTKMNENFKGGLDNVMPRYNDPVDSRYHQRCVDNRHWSWTRASVCGKPIREKGRFGCLDTSVRDADWLDECSVVLNPVGDIRIEYIGDPVDRGESTDAAPLTELLDFYTLLHIYNICATRSAWIWIVDDRSGVTFSAELCIP